MNIQSLISTYILFILLPAFGLINAYRQKTLIQNLKKHGLRVTGHIEGITKQKGGYSVTYHFGMQGVTYRHTQMVSSEDEKILSKILEYQKSHKDLKIKKHNMPHSLLEVTYLENNPQESMLLNYIFDYSFTTKVISCILLFILITIMFIAIEIKWL
jgi:hypothetical protein